MQWLWDGQFVTSDCYIGEMSAADDTAQTQALWENFISSPFEVIFFQLIAVGLSCIYCLQRN